MRRYRDTRVKADVFFNSDDSISVTAHEVAGDHFAVISVGHELKLFVDSVSAAHDLGQAIVDAVADLGVEAVLTS